jgi:cholesterol oxidase
MSETTSLQFTEEMKGFVTLDETDPQRGYDQGRADGTRLMFHLTIRTEDVDGFVSDPQHEAAAGGYVDCDAFGGERPVQQGVFNLFVGDRPEHRKMLYRLFFADSVGHPLTLSGFKDVYDDPGFDVWRDTSTLYTTVYAGHVAPSEESTARVVAAGIITIHIPDFVKQLTTFRVAGPGVGAIPAGLEKFGRLFLGQLWAVYGRHLSAADPAS